MAKRGLGRGLGAIFGEDNPALLKHDRQDQATDRMDREAAPDRQKDDKTDAKKTGTGKAASGKAASLKDGHKKDTGSRSGVKGAAGYEKSSGSSAVKAPGVRDLGITKAETDKSPETEPALLRISKIEPNRSQPRKNFEEESLSELAESIKRFGVIQPLIVRKSGSVYKLIAGERRWRAARLAGLKEVPVIIRDFEDEDAAEIALIENIQREDLSPLEEARAYRELMDSYGLTQEALSEKVSKSRASIANSLRLLQLPEEVLELLEAGRLSFGHARCLITIEDKESLIGLAREIADKGLSVREAEKRAAALKRNAGRLKAEKQEAVTEEAERRHILIEALARELTDGLGTKVSIREGSKDRGRIEIEYYSLDELNRITDRLR